MAKRIVLAGAAGVAGRRLCPLLVEAGYHVCGTTRKKAAADWLQSVGVTPIIVDAFDAVALTAAIVKAAPEIVVHQLTDLTNAFAPGQMEEAIRRNAKIRVEGTRNLISAAV